MNRVLPLLLLLVMNVAVSGQAGHGWWKNLSPVPTARQEVATAVLNGKIYVIAGFDINGASTSTVEFYDPASDRWATAASIPLVNNHNAAAVAGGKLYSFGG